MTKTMSSSNLSLACMDRLGVELAAVPLDKLPVVDERTAIFVAGMLAQMRAETNRPAPIPEA